MEEWQKALALVLLFCGEALAIYAEMIGARSQASGIEPFLPVFLRMFLLIAIAGGLLVAGYMLGISAFKDIWVVSVASITSILIAEPILIYAVFQEVPRAGPAIGFVLGALGLAAALFL